MRSKCIAEAESMCRGGAGEFSRKRPVLQRDVFIKPPMKQHEHVGKEASAVQAWLRVVTRIQRGCTICGFIPWQNVQHVQSKKTCFLEGSVQW